MPKDTTLPYEDTPEHMIIWLSLDIGSPDRHHHLKMVFSTNTNPICEVPIKLNDRDYDDMLRVEGPTSVNFEGVCFLLAAFTNVERCIECFEQNQDKRIFFITSGSMGQIAVPIILDRFRHTFTDQVTDEPYMSIYVFCHSVEYQINWTFDYRDYIQIFTFDADLLVRMIGDIADYYAIEGKRLLDEDPPNNAAAGHRLSWAHELYQRYGKMEKVSIKKELNEVNELRESVEKELKSSSDEDD